MWLGQNNISFDYYDLLKEPLNKNVLQGIAKLAGIKVIGLINTKSQVYKKLGLDVTTMTEEEALKQMLENPRIIKRPILTGEDLVLWGFKEAEYEAKLL